MALGGSHITSTNPLNMPLPFLGRQALRQDGYEQRPEAARQTNGGRLETLLSYEYGYALAPGFR